MKIMPSPADVGEVFSLSSAGCWALPFRMVFDLVGRARTRVVCLSFDLYDQFLEVLGSLATNSATIQSARSPLNADSQSFLLRQVHSKRSWTKRASRHPAAASICNRGMY